MAPSRPFREDRLVLSGKIVTLSTPLSSRRSMVKACRYAQRVEGIKFKLQQRKKNVLKGPFTLYRVWKPSFVSDDW